jgi:predicted TIM-barrel fold metal-dependent hydrolase
LKIIALEEHFLTSDIRAAWAASPLDNGGTERFETQLEDLGDERIRLMDESGVDVQVLSVTTPGLHNLDAHTSVDLARRTNDLIAATIASRPTRFQGFAALPTPSPKEAARELERSVRSLGLRGAMLCGRTREKNLDHPDFLPMLETAADLRVPLYIHPQLPQRAVRDALYSGFGEQVDDAFASFGLGWHYEAGIQFVRLILAGVFDRLPGLQIILGHWGEVVLFFMDRLNGISRVATLQRPVTDYFRQNLYVTPSGMFNAPYLQRAVEVLGTDRIMFSQDYPYQYRPGEEARHFVQSAPLSEADREKFAHGNWERLASPKQT